MAKAIPHQTARQAVNPHSAALPGSLGPDFLTPGCDYSIINGLLYDHLAADCWLPGDPLLLNFGTDYRPLVRDIRRCRRLLRRELARTISPRRKRQIRLQRESLEVALFCFGVFAEAQADHVDVDVDVDV